MATIDGRAVTESVSANEIRPVWMGIGLIFDQLGRQYGGDPIENIMRRALEYKREREKAQKERA